MENKTPTLRPNVKKGLKCFNDQAYYAAHEYFEQAWRQSKGLEKDLYRALIHLSGGFFRLQQNRPNAAKKFFLHCKKWLKGINCSNFLVNIDLIKKKLVEMTHHIDNGMPSDDILQKTTFHLHTIQDSKSRAP
jgi:predicted metal-dependent hydrolase